MNTALIFTSILVFLAIILALVVILLVAFIVLGYVLMGIDRALGSAKRNGGIEVTANV